MRISVLSDTKSQRGYTRVYANALSPSVPLECSIFRSYYRSGLTPATSFLYAPLTMTHLSNAAEAHLPERRRTLPRARAHRRLIPE